MSQTVQPEVFINYISQRKKIIVSKSNSPTQLIIKTDGNLNEVYNFQIIDGSQRIVELDTEARYQIYGTLTDAKNIQHVLFYTNSFSITNNVLSFVINTYTSQYQTYITGDNATRINISIVKKKGEYSSMVLRDVALAYKRPPIDGQIPTQIVYQDVFTTVVPLSTAFGAGNFITLTETIDDQGEQREIVSFAFGTNLSTSYDNQFVIGYNNEPDATKAFIVANSGNIFTVDYNGNVEAGDLNVGAISATSITVSGEDLNSLVDDKVEYLSTSIDDKLEATSGWVSETFQPISTATENYNTLTGSIDSLSTTADEKFETKAAATESFNALEQDISDLSGEAYGAFELKEDATSKFNTLTGQTNYLSGQIDATNLVVNQVTGTLDAKANKTDLEALSGKVEAIHVPSAVSELENDVPYLSSITSADIPDTYVQVDQLEDYAQKSEIPVLSSSISAFLAQGDNITLSVNENTGVVTINGQAGGGSGKTYSAGTGLALEGEGLSTFVLTATLSSIENDAGFITESALDDYALKSEIPTTVAELSDSGNYALTSQLINTEDVSGVVEAMSATIIDGLATESFVTTQGYQTATNVSDYFTSVSGDIVTAATGAITVPTDEQISGIASAVTESYGYITSADIPTSYVQVDNLTGQILTAYAKTEDIPTNEGISGIASAVVEDLSTTIRTGLASTSEIPTTVAELTDASNYALTSDIKTYQAGTGLALSSDNKTFYLTGTVLQGDNATIAINNNVISVIGGTGGGGKVYQGVSGIAVDNNPQIGQISLTAHIPDSAEISGIAEDVVESLSTTIRTGLATTEQIPTTVAELTDSSDYALVANLPTSYISSSDVSGIVEDMSGAIVSGYATESFVTTQGYVKENTTYSNGNLIEISGDANTINFTGTIPSNSDISGIASAVTTGVVTKEYVNALGIDGTTYTAGTGLGLDQTGGKHEFYLTATIPTVGTLSAGMIEATSATIRSGLATTGEIPTTVAELTDSSDYALKTDLPTVSTYIGGNLISVTSSDTDQYTIAFTGTIPTVPTNVSDFNNDAHYISAITVSAYNGSTLQFEATQTSTLWLASTDFFTFNGEIYINETKFPKAETIAQTYATKTELQTTSGNITGWVVEQGYASGSAISAVGQLINDVGYITGYQAGTGISITNGVIAATGGGGGGTVDVETLSGLLSSANNNLTIEPSGDVILFTAQGGGGGGGSDITDVSDLNNDTGFITAADITNKQRVYSVGGATITYSPSYEVFKTTYSGGSVTLNAVTALTSQIGDGEVATFEEWITFSSSVTAISEGTNTLIGEWPSSIDNTKTHVLVRRLVNNSGTITQYVSYAYNF